MPGIGKIFLAQLQKKNLFTCGDLQTLDFNEIVNIWGQWGARLFDLCRGVDHSLVRNQRVRKSLSVERTFEQDISDWQKLQPWVSSLYEELQFRIQENKIDIENIKNLGVEVKDS